MFAKRLIRVLHSKGCISMPRLDLTISYVTNSSYVNNLNCANENETFNNLNRQTDLIDDTAVRKQKIYGNNPNYISRESYYAHKLLERSQVYSKSLAVRLSHKENLQIDEDILLQKWISMDKADLLNNFQLLSFYASTNNETMNDYKYRGIIEVVISRISQFSTKELCNFLSCLELWNTQNSTMYNTDLLQALDDECLKRMKNWSIDEIFLINDHFFKLKLGNITKFPMKSLVNVNPRKMTPANLVQFAFLLKVNKRIHVNLRDLERCLEKYIDNFNVDELGIIAMAYFKYEISFRSQHFFLKFIHKLVENIDTINNISLSSILKILRHSSDLTTLGQLNILLSLLENQISRLDLPTLTHIAHLKARVMLYNKNLMAKILERYTKEIDKARLKDIERILFSLYIFNYDPQTTSFYTLVNNELLSPYRISEIEAFPRSLVYSVMFMLQINYYPEKVLKYIMEPEFINKFSQKNVNNLDREYLVMDYCIEIDHPEYNGPRLKKYLLNFLQKKCQSKLEHQRLRLKYGDKLMIDVTHTCKQVFGHDSAVYIDSVLPHFIKPDIIICYDPETKQFVSPGEKFSQISQNVIKFAPKDGKEWYVLVMGVHNILTRNTLQPTGILTAKLRHLRKIGYTPIVIPYVNWKLLQSLDEKKKFIESLLNK